MAKILITGASGFVGQALCADLRHRHLDYLPVCREVTADKTFVMQNMTSATDWHQALQGVEVVVHLAARVHLLRDVAADPLAAYREMNTGVTLNLAHQAAQAGVKRLIYLSSVKVNGETSKHRPFSIADVPCPADPYGVSKWEAEQGLQKIAQKTGLEVVIIRPPLVYGPGVKANFLRLMQWVARGIPLPLAGLKNQRSMVFVGNLTDLIVCCMNKDAAAGQTFMVSDDEDLSTTQLIESLAHAMKRKARLFALPSRLLMRAASLAGQAAAAERLLDTLQVDIAHTKQTLGWAPPYSVAQGMAETVCAFQGDGIDIDGAKP